MSVRGPQRSWEDVRDGDTLPGHTIFITPTEVAIAVNGSNNLDLVHHDSEYTRSGGHPDLFMDTTWYNGNFGHVLSDFTGTDGWIKKMSQQMRRMNHPGDTTSFKGKVARLSRKWGIPR